MPLVPLRQLALDFRAEVRDFERRGERTTNLIVRMTAEDSELLDELAAASRLSKSAVVRGAIRRLHAELRPPRHKGKKR
jgi:hypothetical protein